ncbi:type II toxin-antitoxin system RelE/ParE family toxin [Thalassobaculum sp.]|uniref:type II toxin-antitoxin system RelE/ParE family toxin n=1 Tax=Thalassobaculum sp. TaxID=2022740 RepID=UPI0032EE4DD8
MAAVLGYRSRVAAAAVRIVWTEPARDDLLRIRAYITEFEPSAASRVAAQLVAAADSLERLPSRGRPGTEPGTREIVAVYPYVIVYRVAEAVEILRVWHGAQDRATD